MKQDLDLIRKILLTVESSSPEEKVTEETFIDKDTDKKTVILHFDLLLDCGYVEIKKINKLSPQDGITLTVTHYQIKRLTSAGYDYLDSVRDNSVWTETKKKIASYGGSIALDVVKQVATSIILGSPATGF